MTQPNLTQIEGRTSKATEGPWEVYSTRGGTYVTRPDLLGVAREWSLVWQAQDAEFIANARQDIPALTEAIRAVLELHERVYANRTYRGWICATCCDRYEDKPQKWPCQTVKAITQRLEGV